jgi:hypothetical protein
LYCSSDGECPKPIQKSRPAFNKSHRSIIIVHPMNEEITAKVEQALGRLIVELGHDESDLSRKASAVISEELERGKRAAAEAIAAARRMQESMRAERAN